MSANGPFLPGLFHQGTAHGQRGCPHAAASSPTRAWTAAAAVVVAVGAAERPADAPQLWTFSHPEGDISMVCFFFKWDVYLCWCERDTHLFRLAR